MSAEAETHDPRKFFVRFAEVTKVTTVRPDTSSLEGLRDVEEGAEVAVCEVPLLSPARAVGAWMVSCQECGASVVCLAAGMDGDPRSVSLPCRKTG